MSKHLYFYSDASEWGGQEILSARIANILAESYQVHFFFSAQKFDSELHPSIERIPLPYHSQGPFPIVRDRFSGKSGKAFKLLKEHGAGSANFRQLIICPGNIERCIPAVVAASKLNLELISYYPMAFTQKESLAKFGTLRDRLALKVYPKISKWIVNTPYQERLLRRFIPSETPVFQLPNPLTYQEDAAPKAPSEVRNIANIGRLYFGQKGQEIIPPLASLLKEKGVHFHVIGQGPDRDIFNKMVQDCGTSNVVHNYSWLSPNEVKEKLQNQMDLLLVTSKFESGPMVLFEALQCGIPVLAANEEYVKDYRLPCWMTYDPGNVQDAVQKILDLPQAWNQKTFEEVRQFLFAGRRDQEFQQLVLNIFSQI